nr:unnamed protein product [Callosobruchus chinensis]
MLVNYLWLLNICPNLKIVDHKFLLRGHTHMEADHGHGLIERILKNEPTMKICTPWDRQNLIRSAGAEVTDMELHDFKNVGCLYGQPQSSFINKKKNTEKEDFLISTVSHIQAQTDVPNTVFYKESFSDADSFKTLRLSRTSRKRTPMPVQLLAMRKTPKGVTKKKHQHLMRCLEYEPNIFLAFTVKKNKLDDISDSDGENN